MTFYISGVRGLSHNPLCPPQGPGVIQVPKRWRIADDRPLGREDDAQQSARVLGSHSSIPNDDGGGEDGLNDGSVKSASLLSSAD